MSSTARDPVFVAYPGNPSQISSSFHGVASLVRENPLNFQLKLWEQSDIAGHFIAQGILSSISVSPFIIADITRLNFNVTFEIGYAIARRKRVILTVNSALTPDFKELAQLGIFDTIGYERYSNANELYDVLDRVVHFKPLTIDPPPINKSAPLYILDTLYKTDTSIRILSKVKNRRLKFRSFDPKELPRLSATDAFQNVSSSIGVIVNLLSSNTTDHYFNNLRGAFLAGLAFGFEKRLLLLQEGDGPVPLDYRDLVRVYRHPDDIDKMIGDFAPNVFEELLADEPVRKKSLRLLEQLNLGAPAAENEASTLQRYYVPTDEYITARRGATRLAVGRKGSGKTALFYSLRDEIRRNSKNVVVDLKPDGYQLKRFKDVVLINLTDGVKEHAATAFWEYILILELCYRLLENDKEAHLRDHQLYDLYKSLHDLYEIEGLGKDEDFSERMLRIINRISDSFENKNGAPDKGMYLTSGEVTSLIYSHDIPKLRATLRSYLIEKNEVWILFDNIDKGWPTHGVEPTDIVILRGLLDANRKIKRTFDREDVHFVSVVFVRNDVYGILIDETPDRGKQTKVSLDWTDPDLLREFLRRRITYEAFSPEDSFDSVWPRIACASVTGEESSDFLISRSVMRPRNLLNLLNYAKANAVNLNHDLITEDDFIKAWESYSADLVNDIGFEIRDVIPEAEDFLYNFIGSASLLTLKEILDIFEKSNLPPLWHQKVLEVLFWFAFLGVCQEADKNLTGTFIYDVFYDMKKLRILSGNLRDPNTVFCVHRAFWPFLEINGTQGIVVS